MRKFLLKVSFFVVYVLILNVVLPIWIDPFNVFHWDNIRANGVDPNQNYIKMKYILANPDKFDSFIFGSSRVGAIHTDKITDERCYNMILLTGLPGWHLLNIKTMFENGITPRKIYIGVDTVSYTGDYANQYNDPTRCPYEYLKDDVIQFVKLYFDTSAIARSLVTMLKAKLGRIKPINTEIFYKYGWYITYDRESNFDWNDKSNFDPAKKHGLFYGSKDHQDMPSTLQIMREITEACRVHGTELIIFTNPMNHITYKLSIERNDYVTFLEGLAEISDFWNFSSLNDITLNNANYIETSHYRAQVGDILIDIMCNGKAYPELQAQGFGVKVTRENVKDFIAMLKKQVENYEKLHQ